MPFINRLIEFKNFEEVDIQIQIQQPDAADPGAEIPTSLEGSEFPATMDTPGLDQDKTVSIRPKRLSCGFNSTDLTNAKTFRVGGDDEFLVVLTTGGVAVPFIGRIAVEGITEAFQPRPNPVNLSADDGLSSLKDVELTTTDGELPIGHYSIIDYIVMCLGRLIPGQQIRVIMNLYEEDTDPVTSHAFIDQFVDAERFKKDDSSMVDCLTALTWILDAFGCFICYDHDGWWIIRWDEYDAMGTSILTHKAAVFDGGDGTFQTYELIDLTKKIASDTSADYEGYFLSMDTALTWAQRKASKVVHTFNYSQIDVPCNKNFTRGAVIDDVIPLKAYEVDCWDLGRGFGAHATTPNSEAQIWVRFDANDVESERYLILTPQLSSGGEFNYVRSQAIPIDELDKFDFSFDYSADTDNAVAGPATITIAAIALHGDDGSFWILGDGLSTTHEPEWKLSDVSHNVNADYYRWFITGSEDLTEFRNYSIEAPPSPVSGNLYIHFFAANQLGPGAIDDFVIRYNNVQFTYRPFTNGTYGSINGQTSTVSEDNGSRKVIEKEMFIGDPPKRLFKGALKKFDGTNYILTGLWNDFITPAVLPDSKLSKFIVYQWWNQFRENRTVIESDIQGINSDQEFGIPGMIYRWQIKHEDEGDKYFMLTGFRDMNFANCGWKGVMVEMSSGDGDRIYTDDFEFKYIR